MTSDRCGSAGGGKSFPPGFAERRPPAIRGWGQGPRDEKRRVPGRYGDAGRSGSSPRPSPVPPSHAIGHIGKAEKPAARRGQRPARAPRGPGSIADYRLGREPRLAASSASGHGTRSNRWAKAEAAFPHARMFQAGSPLPFGQRVAEALMVSSSNHARGAVPCTDPAVRFGRRTQRQGTSTTCLILPPRRHNFLIGPVARAKPPSYIRPTARKRAGFDPQGTLSADGRAELPHSGAPRRVR
jgi:hypothetical protein